MPKLEIKNGQLNPVTANYVEVEFSGDAANDLPTGDQIALMIKNDLDLGDVDINYSDYAAVIVEFPSFGDGRAYSQARLLRERYDFKGQIIARGDVLPDQLLYMTRCGINVVELDRNDLSTYNNALSEYSYFYQQSADQITPVWGARVKRKQVAA